ncbi:putative membrane protein YeiB [Nocardiopsis sp. Huas11]|uniref:DUF418 domain-containing protein n=1 Tax=Nocardiopsis sp. Huas11 TaxID=2183912 RepID=UPI000F11B5FE|nr:DUF418 domain-containing protein [Nocardiopsis sp. Huas11]RKS10306.1 putative membrane protein YeiB [Nocardiopsis sp. Huas11]
MTHDVGSPRAAPSPTRSLAPDLARGFMLLFIALANAQFFLVGPDLVRTVADQAVALVQSTLVNARAISLFALVFGYGMVRILERVRAQGGSWVHARVLLRRRGWSMVAIGFVHAALFLPVDIVGTYGLAVLLFVGLLRARDTTLLWTAGAFAAFSAVLSTTLVVLLNSGGEDGSISAPSLSQEVFGLAVVERVQEWLLYTPITLLLVALPMILLGVWAGRRRVLEEPGRHRRLLVRTAVIGLGIAVAVGLPDALAVAQPAPAVSPLTGSLLGVAHDLSGWAGGLGWAAVLALVAWRLEDRRGPLVRAVAAVGERSLTCYLAQSVVFTLVFAPYAGGLGATLGLTGAAVVAVATWASTVVLAEVLRRTGHRGPAEVLLRRLTYARTRHAPVP